MAVRVGAQIQPQHAEYAQMRDTWLRVEEMGADYPELATFERALRYLNRHLDGSQSGLAP